MKQLFTDIRAAINTIISSSQKHALASEEGDYKAANKNYDLIQKAVSYLRENDGIPELKKLLTHNEVSVKIAASSFLLKHYEREAVATFEAIASKSIPHQSFNAKMILQEWKKGNINL